ncbi:SET domain-containing protein-lysine N-methyltransferase [Xanthomonadaceae bacterium JHOS43]|nr:SET domain-containing protein-lysine N-methyltransferase [Xanthomonadaceae bacterium JHOS43]MCX7563305.1 SET domain-containing protein-lysine N-methyltransferase [Xanthomonadaceae bacterium XH05]
MSRLIERRRSRIHGNGVFATVDIPAGKKVCNYIGDIITHDAADALYADTLDTGHTFLFTLNDEYIVDGNRRGNIARWINHGCTPNCEARIAEHPGDDRRLDRVEIHAIRDIAAGEELTYNYGIRLEVPHTARLKTLWACRCGASECSGTMLQPKR